MFQKKQEPPCADLSARENEVLELVAKGSTNPEIAASLSVSENTVRFHMKNIFEKLSVTNRTEAAAWYFKQQMPPDYAGK
jgi:DNA-binding NarL/FixJ family response regulator